MTERSDGPIVLSEGLRPDGLSVGGGSVGSGVESSSGQIDRQVRETSSPGDVVESGGKGEYASLAPNPTQVDLRPLDDSADDVPPRQLTEVELAEFHRKAGEIMGSGDGELTDQQIQVLKDLYLKYNFCLNASEARALRYKILPKLGAGAALGEFDPGIDNPSDWFFDQISYLNGEPTYYNIPSWPESVDTTDLKRFCKDKRYREFQPFMNALIALHNLVYANDQGKAPAEMVTCAEGFEMKHFNALFNLPGVAEAFMDLAAGRGDDLVDAQAVGNLAGEQAAHDAVVNNINGAFIARHGMLTAVPRRPNEIFYAPIIERFTPEMAETIGYQLWVAWGEREARYARQLIRFLNDSVRNPAGLDWFGDRPEEDVRLVDLGVDERIYNNKVAGLYNPFPGMRYFNIGEEAGRAAQKVMWEDSFDYAIFPFVSRRVDAIAEAWARSNPAVTAGVEAAVLANPNFRTRTAQEEEITRRLKNLAGLGAPATDLWGDPREEGGGFIWDISHFNPRSVNWAALPRNFFSLTRNFADHAKAQEVKEGLEGVLGQDNPLTPDALFKLFEHGGNVAKQYTSGEEARRMYGELLKLVVILHRSGLPFLERVPLGAIPLSVAQRYNSDLHALTAAQVKRLAQKIKITGLVDSGMYRDLVNYDTEILLAATKPVGLSLDFLMGALGALLGGLTGKH